MKPKQKPVATNTTAATRRDPNSEPAATHSVNGATEALLPADEMSTNAANHDVIGRNYMQLENFKCHNSIYIGLLVAGHVNKIKRYKNFRGNSNQHHF